MACLCAAFADACVGSHILSDLRNQLEDVPAAELYKRYDPCSGRSARLPGEGVAVPGGALVLWC